MSFALPPKNGRWFSDRARAIVTPIECYGTSWEEGFLMGASLAAGHKGTMSAGLASATDIKACKLDQGLGVMRLDAGALFAMSIATSITSFATTGVSPRLMRNATIRGSMVDPNSFLFRMLLTRSP
jgi:hypothetical protein